MKKILFITILLLSMSSLAQVNIGMGYFGLTAPNDTVSESTSDTYSVWVKNYGPGTLNDYITLITGVRDSVGGIDSVGYYTSPGNIILTPGDSTMLTLTTTYNVSPTGYRYGIDVIVIWPVAASATTLDSLEFTVFIKDATGLNELDAEQLIDVYPNPAADNIHIKHPDATAIESIEVFDLSGRLVLSEKKQSTINIESLPAGMFTVQVILSDKKKYLVKMIRKK